MLRYIVIIGIIILFFTFSGKTQDIHFSQYDVNVTTLNPAYAGVMKGDFRIANNYRNQWMTISTPYSTVSFAGDMNILNKKSNKGLSDVGIALGFFSDKVGTSKLAQNQFSFAVSAIQQITFDTKLSFGMQGAYNQQTITMNDLSWDTQFVGHKYDASLPSQENFANRKAAYIDINTGLLLQNEGWDNRFTMGVAGYHLNSPKRGIFSNEKLAPKIVGHASYEIKIGNRISLKRFIPKLLYTMQRKHREILLGGVFRQYLNEGSRFTQFSVESYFDVGMYYRVGDAIVITGGMSFKRFRVGLSYDANISKLSKASNTIGGFEVSLVYNGLFSDRRTKLIKPS